MKKNVMMRVASTLLVAVLLTTCTISGTFAKYTTSAKGSMFSKNYNDFAGGNGIAATAQGSVDSSNEENILAPGTKGTMTSMTLTGTPEVKVQVTYGGTVTLNGKWLAKQSADAAESYYCPLKVTVGTDTLYGLDYSSEADFKAAIEGKIAAYNKIYDALTDLSEKGDDALAISWEWAFEGSKGTVVDCNDYADTYLGNATEKGDITIEVTTIVTQVD